MIVSVLHVITGLNDGGAEGVLKRICLFDKDKGFVHHVVCLSGIGKHSAELENEGIKVFHLEVKGFRSCLNAIWKFKSVLNDIKPNVIQTWMYHSDLFGGIFGRLFGFRAVIWNIRQTELSTAYVKKSTIWLAKIAARLSHTVPLKIVSCGERAKSFHAHFGYDESKMIVVGNGFNLNAIGDLYSIDQIMMTRESFGIGPSEIIIGMVGRFDPVKNHRGLLEALSELNHFSYRLLLIGEGLSSENPELSAWIVENNLSNKVILLGQRADVFRFYQLMDIHVLPSHSEGFPNVLIEAMAVGTPCIVTDAGDAAMIVKDTGWVVPVRNTELLKIALQDAMEECLNDKQQFELRKLDSIKRVKENYTLNAMVNKYHQVWLN